jgi:hypothetical protein
VTSITVVTVKLGDHQSGGLDDLQDQASLRIRVHQQVAENVPGNNCDRFGWVGLGQDRLGNVRFG